MKQEGKEKWELNFCAVSYMLCIYDTIPFHISLFALQYFHLRGNDCMGALSVLTVGVLREVLDGLTCEIAVLIAMLIAFLNAC